MTRPRPESAPTSDARIVWVPALLFIAVALILRGVYLYQITSIPFFDQPVGDARGYYDWARRLAAASSWHQWLGDTPFYQAPLYPYVLACWFKIAGDGFLGIRIFQALLGALACGCLAYATARLFDRSAGWIAGLMLAFYAPAIFFDGLIQKASLAAFLLCAMLACMAHVTVHRRAWPAALTGLLLGLLIITRENAMIWIPVLLIWSLTSGASPCPGRWFSVARFTEWRTLPALIVGLLLVLVPVGLRNLSVGGQWSISTFQAGPNFYIGNSLSADGRYRPLIPGHETPQFERRDATQIAQRDAKEVLTPRQVSSYWMRRCFDEIRTSPARWIRLMMLKTMMVLNAYEVGDVESLVVYARQSIVLAVLSRVWHFGTLMPLACAGLVFTWRRRRVLWVYYILVITMVAAVALFFVLGRYRYPLVPLMIPFAAVAVVTTWRCLRTRDFRPVRLPLAAAAVGFVFCNLIKVHPTDLLDASAFMNLGVAYAQRNHPDDLDRAMRCFAQAVAENPGSPEAHYNLALALDQRGDVHGAIRHYQAALLRAPTLIHADYNLAVALEKAQRDEQALIHYRKAIALDPADADAKAAIARIGAR